MQWFIINVQCSRPDLGAIHPSQADYLQPIPALALGDYHLMLAAPCSVQEMVDTVTEAFDMADKYLLPVMILADGLLGQMMEPVTFPEKKTDFIEKPWATDGHANKRKHNITNSLYLQLERSEEHTSELQ